MAHLFRIDETTWAAYQGLLVPTVVETGTEAGAETGTEAGAEAEEVVATALVTAAPNQQTQKWEILSSALNLTGMDANPRSMIIFELIIHLVEFCSESGFSFAQMSAVLSIFGDIFASCIIVDPSCCRTREEAIAMFTEQISRHAKPSAGNDKQMPPLFTVESIKRAAEFFSETIIKQFDAYQYVMSSLPVERPEKLFVVVQTPVTCLQPLS